MEHCKSLDLKQDAIQSEGDAICFVCISNFNEGLYVQQGQPELRP
jgi:hypothetical protein